MKTPISLIIDDSAPLVHIYRAHSETKKSRDGRPLPERVPNALLDKFCDIVETFGIKGKFSVVPMPAGKGTLSGGIEGFPKSELDAWLDTVKTRLNPYFDFCPELLTHCAAVNLKNGGFFDKNEREWASGATREEMADYVSRALELCLAAGIECTGVTSPWDFGADNEAVYAHGVADAFERVMGKTTSWYFLHGFGEQKNIRAWVELAEDGKTVVSVPRTVADYFWGTIDINDTSEDFISRTADYFLSRDGKRGAIIDALERNNFPVICTHWQSMFSCGNMTGVRALAEVARRIGETLSDRVEWVDFSYQTALAIRDNVKRPVW